MAGVAVVTGGSAGIGLATARRLAERGWSVALIAREPARLEEAAASITARGARVLAIPADASDAAAIDAAAERIEATLGPIRAWINNAMSTIVGPADKIGPDEYRRVTETTYLSAVHGTLAALRHMKPRGRGAIVQVSSGLAIRAAPLQAPYCAAKAAVGGFTDALRAELIHERVGVSLSVVYLPAVNTPQFDWSRTRTGRNQVAPDPVFSPALCAEAIVGAVESPQREIWVGRSTLMMAAAQAIAPGFADRKAAEAWDSQLSDGAMPDRKGNLFEPVPGPAATEGRFGDREKPTRTEFWTSRERDLLMLGVAGSVFLGSAAVAGLLSAPRRLLRGR
ncbi:MULTISPECIES: SDR family oxidoreductase [Methylobacterium]|uniref:Ketoreductase domain-containing protein n=2 Tax=Pseudomonadota TaxID=1224 RepID=A0ABQ4STK5_9HYPH|nr:MULTISPECIES: SDR family oxidoreductase [Methylobacterium]PIU04338.1 MAG: short-chain dehydrogenase [Methylobacterium sp. CG09_land_8_20_14_0_10_71_15]PIU12460.1 MAG: short-chain dehydrogenase [Methylobacterium sp. CG08_land_8_20_14_0_20_71_15]GBU19601.1 short-chain dehydrogenase [Methylobacterium sp.]GJE06554.1 hypothetical protein AOPFMNJM_1875 [Methylobacterium jeotgali]